MYNGVVISSGVGGGGGSNLSAGSNRPPTLVDHPAPIRNM